MPRDFIHCISTGFTGSGILVVQRRGDLMCALVKADWRGDAIPGSEFWISSEALSSVGRALIELSKRIGYYDKRAGEG